MAPCLPSGAAPCPAPARRGSEAMEIVSLGPWLLFFVAAALMLMELAAPGMFLFWFGLAAAATGLVDLVIDLSWQRELLLFAVLALAFAFLGRNLMRRLASEPQDKPF